MLKIWGRANSSNVKKVLWCAEELGLAYTRIDAGGPFGRVDDADYRALNPNGLVPVIEDDGFVLWESNAIVRYLAAKHGIGTLYPSMLQESAIAEQWMDWAATSFNSLIGSLMWNLVRAPEPQRDLKAAEQSAKRCGELFTIADAVLSRQPYLGGEVFSLADIALGPIAYLWFNLPIERPSLPHLEAWQQRMEERPAYRKIVMLPIT